ncbi:MAG TPA: diguanylate cyclase [Actinomycetota bacterium]|nr:diguanylate cyclase [Actinomycetota bacterium]
MSLRQKLMAVLAIPAIVLILATALAYQANARRVQGTDQITRTYEVLNELEAIIAELNSAESGLRGYLITGNAEMINPYERSRRSLLENVAEMRAVIVNAEAERLAQQLSEHIHRRLRTLDSMAKGDLRGPSMSDDRKELTRQGELTMQLVDGVAEKLRTRQLELLDERTRKLSEAENLAFVIRMIGLPGGLLAAGVMVALFAGRLLRRIESLSENTRRLERGLPLLRSSGHRDELGELERAFVQTGTKVMQLQGELQRLATVDALTGLANRRGFLDTAEHRLDLARRNAGSTLALLFVDADGLKVVNDTHGHTTGDEMLQELGALLRDTFRMSDLPARLGGDEFCVLVTADSIAGVDVARTRLADAIAMANRLPGRTYALSVSMGIAVFDREHDRSVDDLIARADTLMYEEKRRKRADADGSGHTAHAGMDAPFPPLGLTDSPDGAMPSADPVHAPR